MAWNLDINKILKLWAVEPKPLISNERLITLVEITQRMLNRTFSNLDDRISQDPDLLADLNFVASTAIQRNWYDDPRGYSSQSEGVGPFSKSISIESSKNGLYFTEDEINFLTPESNGENIFMTVRFGKVKPNFSIRSNRSWRDWKTPGEYHNSDKIFGWWR